MTAYSRFKKKFSNSATESKKMKTSQKILIYFTKVLVKLTRDPFQVPNADSFGILVTNIFFF